MHLMLNFEILFQFLVVFWKMILLINIIILFIFHVFCYGIKTVVYIYKTAWLVEAKLI